MPLFPRAPYASSPRPARACARVRSTFSLSISLLGAPIRWRIAAAAPASGTASPRLAARALELAFGRNDIPVTATWKQSGGLPDVSHDFDGFWEAAEEQSESRVYGGVHYRFDQVAVGIGRSAAEFVFANYMTRSCWQRARFVP